MPEDSKSNLTVISSVFLNNTSKFFSNAIFFTGLEIKIVDSMFSNNNPYYDEESKYIAPPKEPVLSSMISAKTVGFSSKRI